MNAPFGRRTTHAKRGRERSLRRSDATNGHGTQASNIPRDPARRSGSAAAPRGNQRRCAVALPFSFGTPGGEMFLDFVDPYGSFPFGTPEGRDPDPNSA